MKVVDAGAGGRREAERAGRYTVATRRRAGAPSWLLLLVAMPLLAPHVRGEGVSVPETLPFGTCFCFPGDVNADGAQDIVASTPTAGKEGSGVVMAVSGKSGQCLWAVMGAGRGEQFGRSMCVVGDINGDGVQDVLAGGPFASNEAVGLESCGVWRVLCGKTGKPLREQFGEEPGGRGGWDTCLLKDQDGDGVSEYAVGFPTGGRSGGAVHGRVAVYSGKSGKLMWSKTGATAGGWFGAYVANGPDADKDGCADLLIGAPQVAASGSGESGGVALFGGRTGKLLWQVFGEGAEDQLGSGVSGIGDCNGDGVTDVLASAPHASVKGRIGSGYCLVLSGTDGRRLRRWESLAPGSRFGLCAIAQRDSPIGVSPVVFVSAPHERACHDVSAPEYDLAGAVYSVKCSDWTVLWKVTSVSLKEGQLGSQMVECADWDGDGAPDVGALVQSDLAAAIPRGRVFVLSGRNGSVLSVVREPSWMEVVRSTTGNR